MKMHPNFCVKLFELTINRWGGEIFFLSELIFSFWLDSQLKIREIVFSLIKCRKYHLFLMILFFVKVTFKLLMIILFKQSFHNDLSLLCFLCFLFRLHSWHLVIFLFIRLMRYFSLLIISLFNLLFKCQKSTNVRMSLLFAFFLEKSLHFLLKFSKTSLTTLIELFMTGRCGRSSGVFICLLTLCFLIS